MRIKYTLALLCLIGVEQACSDEPEPKGDKVSRLIELFQKGEAENELTKDDKAEACEIAIQLLPKPPANRMSWKTFYFDNDGTADVLQTELIDNSDTVLMNVTFQYDSDTADEYWPEKLAGYPSAGFPDSWVMVRVDNFKLKATAKSPLFKQGNRLKRMLEATKLKALAASKP